MKLKKITAVAVSLTLFSALTVSYTSFAENTAVSDPADEQSTSDTSDDVKETCTVTFVDYNGNTVNTQELEKGSKIDYSLIDTTSSAFNYNVDTFTQRMFEKWNIQPETAEQDITISALYKELVISLDNPPEKTTYNSLNEQIDPTGLKVTITISVPTDEFDENDNRIYSSDVTDISSTCTLSPSDTGTAFADSNTAEIKIFPISSNVSVGSYTITFEPLKGDTSLDGNIDAFDASLVLAEYASVSMGERSTLSDIQKKVSDVNSDGAIDSLDASMILKYYTELSSGMTPSWE